jgi:hypothetical protein
MRKVRITHPKGLFVGDSWRPKGTVVDVPDDHRARQLCDLGHCEMVAQVAEASALDAHMAEHERGTASKAPERAARR